MNNNNLTMGANDTQGDALERVRTAGSISIPPELFEKLYLSPENRVKGDLRKTFGNPTPLYVPLAQPSKHFLLPDNRHG